MKISVITVCKNAKNAIEDTIISVINQSYNNIEYIIIDGASDDGTVDIIEKYKDKISCFISEHDKGVYFAMNKGIRHATGDVLLFLNAGDMLFDNSIFSAVNEQFNVDNNWDILFGDVQPVENGKYLNVLTYGHIKKPCHFLSENLCHQAMYIKPELFKKYGLYDEKYRIRADYDFNLKVLINQDVRAKYINKILVKYLYGGLSSMPDNNEHSIVAKKYLNKVYWCYLYDRFFMGYFGTPYKFLKKQDFFKKLTILIFEVIARIYKLKTNIY